MSLTNKHFPMVVSVFFAMALIFSSLNAAASDDHEHEDDDKRPVDKVHGPLSVMVLGSGGPAPTPSGERASAGYMVFTDGQPRVLMDVGSGTYARFVASGVNAKDLDIVLLSHLHIDHMADMSSMVKAIYFQNRANNLNPETDASFPPGRTAKFRFFGPNENGIPFPPVLDAKPKTAQYPATTEFVHAHYDLNEGIERYLNIFSRAISGGIFGYTPIDVSPNWLAYEPVTIIDEDGLVIKAVGVNHGPVPALAYRIEYKGKSIVYSGDTSSRSTDPDGNPLPNGGNMISISQDADLLIYDTAIMDDIPNGPNDAVFYALHTTPSRMGEVATAAGVKKLVLSHITGNTEPRLDQVKSLVRAQGFKGDISVAKDLKVYNVGRKHR